MDFIQQRLRELERERQDRWEMLAALCEGDGKSIGMKITNGIPLAALSERFQLEPSPSQSAEILNIEQAATLLNVHSHTIRRMIKTGRLKAAFAGGWRIKKQDIDDLFYLRSNFGTTPIR